jgi:acyl carrier protein
MTNVKILKSPYDLVAKAIDLDPKFLDENSEMGVTPNWDSLNHMSVIVEIEDNYGIEILNDDIVKYSKMKAIINLYNELSGNISTSQGIKKFLKRIPFIKVFFK